MGDAGRSDTPSTSTGSPQQEPSSSRQAGLVLPEEPLPTSPPTTPPTAPPVGTGSPWPTPAPAATPRSDRSASTLRARWIAAVAAAGTFAGAVVGMVLTDHHAEGTTVVSTPAATTDPSAGEGTEVAPGTTTDPWTVGPRAATPAPAPSRGTPGDTRTRGS
jgi:hypothetical protein